MNKRGILCMKFIVKGVIALIVFFLVIGIFFGFGLYGKIAAILPDLDVSDRTVGADEFNDEGYRYNPGLKKLEVFEGRSWKAAENGKTQRIFDDYYYDGRDVEEIELDGYASEYLFNTGDDSRYGLRAKYSEILDSSQTRVVKKGKDGNVEYVVSDEDYGPGPVTKVSLINTADGLEKGSFYVKPDGEYEFVRGANADIWQPKDDDTAYHKKIVAEAIKWRQSVFTKPIEIDGKCYGVTQLDDGSFGVDFRDVVDCDDVLEFDELDDVEDNIKEIEGELYASLPDEAWTYDYAIAESRKKQGKYSDNKLFVDLLHEKGLLTDEQYDEINGGLFGIGEETMEYVLNQLRRNQALDKVIEEGKIPIPEQEIYSADVDGNFFLNGRIIPIRLSKGFLTAYDPTNTAPTPISVIVGELENNRVVKIKEGALNAQDSYYGLELDDSARNHLAEINGKDITELLGKEFNEIPNSLLKTNVYGTG